MKLSLFRTTLLSAALFATVINADTDNCAMPGSETEAPVTTTATPATTTSAPSTDYGNEASPVGDAAPSSDYTEASTSEASTTSTTTTTLSGDELTSAGTATSVFSFTGTSCGGTGSYDQVTDLSACSTQSVSKSNAVSPLDDGIGLVFRGPMTIHNIAVFDGSSNGTWSKVSSYEKGNAADNMVFFNNLNPDSYGTGISPQAYASEDGCDVASEPTTFGGTLAAATDPNSDSIYPCVVTGAEVHILSGDKCTDEICPGFYSDIAHAGWRGSKKIFVTKVEMPNDGDYNIPAIWALNDQVLHASQYGCNCRGEGPAGGCGEFDIAEVLEADKTNVATHFYFYNGEYNPGSDTWAPRPTDGAATYVTIIDEDYGLKVLAIGEDDFDFSCGSISADVVSEWENADSTSDY